MPGFTSRPEIVPLLQIAPSKTDAERLLLVSPELGEVLAAIICRVRGSNGAIPLVAAYDDRERQWLPPAPVLFQRHVGSERRAIGVSAVRAILMAAIDWQAAVTALDHGLLPCSSGERHVLKLAASIAAGTPVSLSDALTGIDRRNASPVAEAVAHASALSS